MYLVAVLFDTGLFSVLTSGGAIVPGATLTWYDAGTTTPVNTYTTAAANVANANPVVADANGRFGQIWLNSGSYKYVLKSSAGTTLKTVDNYSTVFTSVALDTTATVEDGTGTARLIGYRGIPSVPASGATVLALSHVGECIDITTGGVTVPAEASVAFAVGDTIQVYNDSASSQSIIAASGVTLRLAGTATTGDRTLALRGWATLRKQLV